MPYIKVGRRAALAADAKIEGPGELNYLLTNLLKRYWVNSAQNYQVLNDIVGALEGAKAEFQRRIVVPYEIEKKEENGDVY